MSIYDLKARKEAIFANSQSALDGMQGVIDETQRVRSVAANSRQHFREIEGEFSEQTGLNGIDMTFLFFATALQCIRQYILTNFEERMTDQDAAKKVKGNTTEHSDRDGRWYNPSLDTIITNPVPFDATFGSADFGLGLGGINHRAKTLGHDPLLGWVFGTANIATSTLTEWNFNSYHIKTGLTSNGNKRDKISYNADTYKVLCYAKNKMLHEDNDGKIIMTTSLVKEAIHLKSDIGSKLSLPLPIISTISPEFSMELTKYGIDTAGVLAVGKQATYSIFINMLVSLIHRLMYDSVTCKSLSLYEVRTRKILMYSNLLATSSNILVVALESYFGNTKSAMRRLDIGGFLVTLYRLINDTRFIYKVKEDFIFNNFNNKIRGIS